MITLRRAKIDDILMLADNAMDESLAGRSEDYIREWARYDVDSGPAFAAVYEGGVVAVAGIRLVRPSVGFIWIVMAKDIDKNSYSFMKAALFAMRKMTEILVRRHSLKKVRALSEIGFAGSQRRLEHLGFERLRRTTKNHYVYLLRS